jgi:hypothetical protein
MDRSFLVKGDAAVEVTCRTEEVHTSLPIVVHVRVIDLRLCKEEHLRAKIVPFYLGTISLEECFRASGSARERR